MMVHMVLQGVEMTKTMLNIKKMLSSSKIIMTTPKTSWETSTTMLMEVGLIRHQLRIEFSRSTRATKVTDTIETEEIKKIRRNRNTITLTTRKSATKEEEGERK